MSRINCWKLRSLLWERGLKYFADYPFLSGDEKKSFREILRKKKFRDELDFFKKIKKEIPESKEYVDKLIAGLESAKVTTSHTYWFIDANFKANQYKYTVEQLENIIKAESKEERLLLIQKLKSQIKKQEENIEKLIDILQKIWDTNQLTQKDIQLLRRHIWDDISDEVLEKLISKDNLTKEEVLEIKERLWDKLWKIIIESKVVLENLEWKNVISNLKSLVQNFKDKQAEYTIKSINMWNIAYDLNNKIASVVKEKEKYFLDWWTVERNLKRIKQKWEFKEYVNLYKVYKNSYWKTEDIIKLVKSLDSKDPYTTISDVINRLNKDKKYNFQIIEQTPDRVIVRDNITGNEFVLTRDMLWTDIEQNIIHYMKLFDWNWILSAWNVAVWEQSYNTFTRQKLAETVEKSFYTDIDNINEKLDTVREVYKWIDNLNENGLKKLYDMVKDIEWDITATHQWFADLLVTIPERLSARLKEQLDDMITDKFLSSFWFTQLMANIEYIEAYNPEFAQFLRKVQIANETLISEIHKDVIAKVYKYLNSDAWKQFIEDIENNLPLYVIKDFVYSSKAISKELKDTLLKEMEDKYFELMQNPKTASKNSVYQEIAQYLSSKYEIYKTSDNPTSAIQTDLVNIEKKFQDSKDHQYDWFWFYWYLYTIFKSSDNNLEIIAKQIADSYWKSLNIYSLEFIEKIQESVLTLFTEWKNISSWLTRIRTSMKHINNAMSTHHWIKEWKYFEYQLKTITDDERVIKRITEDLNWVSLYWDSGFWKMFWKMRNLTYRIKMTAFGWKWISIAMQNLTSNFLEWASLFWHYEDTYKEFHKALISLKDTNPSLFKIYKDVFSASETEITKYVDEQQHDIFTKMRVFFLNKYYNSLHKLFDKKTVSQVENELSSVLKKEAPDNINELLKEWKADVYEYIDRNKLKEIIDKYNIPIRWEDLLTTKWREAVLNEILDTLRAQRLAEAVEWKWTKLVAFITNPAGVIDDFSKDAFLKRGIYNKVIHDRWININEFKTLVEEVRKWNTEARNKLEKLLIDVQSDVLKEYNSFFKVAYASWLTRNNFSRWFWLNHFASWWSKKFGDYLYHIFLTPIRTSVTVAKHTWSIKAGMEAGLISLMTDQKFQAFLRQLWILQVAAYNLDKWDEVDVPLWDFIKENTLIWQSINTFVITRAFKEAVRSAKIASENGYNFALWALFGLQALLRNVFAEPRFILSLPVTLLADVYEEWFKPDRLLEITKLWLFNKMNSTFLYNILDYYKWAYSETIDLKDDVHFIEWLFWINLTEYSDYKWELTKTKQILSALKNKNPFHDIWFGALFYSDERRELEANELFETLRKDTTIQQLKVKPQLWSNNPEVVEQLWNEVMKAWLLRWWGPGDKWELVKSPELNMLFEELREKWYNPDLMVKAIRHWIVTWNDREVAKVLTLLDSKWKSVILLSYVLKSEYQRLKKEYKEYLWVKSLPVEAEQEIKEKILRYWIPFMARLNKQFHVKLISNYIEHKYKDVEKWYTEKWKLRENINDMIQTRLFASVVNETETGYKSFIFDSAPVKKVRDIIKNTPDDRKVEALWKYFDKLSSLVPTKEWEMITKAAILYANKSLIGRLLKEHPEKYRKAALKLAEVIFDVDDELDQLTLESLWWRRWSAWRRLARWDKLTKEQRKLWKDIKEWVSKLARDILKNPSIRDRYLKRLYKKIDLDYKPFDYEPRIDEPKFRYERPRDIQSKILEVKRKYLKSKRARRPKTSDIKKALKQAKSN